MDIRLEFANEVMEQIGAQLYAGRCPDCSHPLLIKPEQGVPFCWFCTTDRISAQRARTVLTKARMAARGIVIEEHREAPAQTDDDQGGRWWPEGVAL